MANKLLIGIVDEKEEEIVNIRQTMKLSDYTDENMIEYEFININPSLDEFCCEEKILDFVIGKIQNKEIFSLIVDYELIVNGGFLKGSNIVEKLKQIVPLFPIVILTQKIEDSINEKITDCDKIYEKGLFFDLESDYHFEKMKNITTNCIKYKDILFDLLNEHNEIIAKYNKLKSESSRGEMIERLLENETVLQKYYPIDDTVADRTINAEVFKNILENLKQIKDELE